MTASDPSLSLAARIARRPLPKGSAAQAARAVDAFLDHLDPHPGIVAERLRACFGRHAEARPLVGAVLDQSPYLSHLARRHPVWLAEALESEPQARLNAIRATFAERAAEASASGDAAAFQRAARHFRNEAALLIAVADCAGVWPVETILTALSDVADEAVQRACNHLLRAQAASGRMVLADPADPGPGSGLVVLALGKHGARELNYSSDIDLVVFFDPEARSLPPDAEPQRLFVRIAKGLVTLLEERTPDGFAFRVDLRLRPDPGSTQAAVSLPAAFSYYEMFGQNWERAAFIKARPVAGDVDLGARFLSDLAPFVWRKYFDFATIADIHAMKRQIHAVRGHGNLAVAGHDIKLGRGGIREIEFFVQTQQLVFGGRRPSLRGSRTLDTLDALAAEGWISDAARRELAEAYRFLREIENRLQMMADQQTQRLPEAEAELAAFARFCGFSGLSAFSKALTAHANRVQTHYALLFEEGPSLATEVGSLVFTGTQDDPDTLATLKRLGFREPARVTETVRGWHFGRRPAVTSQRAREVLTELTPALLAALGRTPDPDGALAALDEAFGHMKAATELLTLLVSNDTLRDLFADVLGTAPRLARIVAQGPHVLDAVIDPAFLVPRDNDAAIEERMRLMVGQPVPMEEFLDRIREVTRQESFLASARLLSRVLSPQRAGEAFAAIAQAALRLTFERVEAAFAGEYGRVPGAAVAILALGRVGAREATATSDLDLVVVYDAPDGVESDGARSLDATTYFGRLTQRLIGAITAPTRRGILYEVDLRLRPSGRRGPLATQFASFVPYFEDEAETWERIALTKARPVAGDADLCRRLAEVVRTILARPREPVSVLADIREMRALLAREKGDRDPWDMKLAAGALTDLDFAAAALILTRSHAHPALAKATPASFWPVAAEEGLLPEPVAQELAEARTLFGDVLQWQRLLVDGPFAPERLSPASLARVAGALGLPDGKVPAAHLDATRARVRTLGARILSGEIGDALRR